LLIIPERPPVLLGEALNIHNNDVALAEMKDKQFTPG